MPKHKRVGKYELFEKLGEGNFSKVKRAIDTETQIQYAIKIVDISSVAKEGMEKQVRNEISVLKQIKHPNVVQLKEVLKSANNIYIVMELITGGELFDKIVAARKFTEDVARRYFQQLIDGIAYCHANRIAHRDLKPENLLLDSHDNLKITDFGLSGMMKQGVMLETICGTPHYVAPEVLTGNYDGFKADIWSCGIILFVMLSGCHPFDGETVNDLFKRIENLEFKYPSHFSKEVRALLDKIIVVDPNNRATIADIRYDPWFKINYNGTLDAMLSSVPNTSNDLVGESGVIQNNVTQPAASNTTTDASQQEGSSQTNENSGTETTQVPLPARIVVNNEDLENAVQDVDINDGEERFVVQDPNQQRVPRGNRGQKVDPSRRRLMTGGTNGSSTERMSIRMQNMEQLNAFELIAVMMRGKLNPLVSKHFTRRANRFSTCGHPDDLYDRMIQYLHEKKFIVRPKETEYEFKAIIKNKLHEMNFAVQFFIVSFEMIIVEVIRLKGNILKFQEIFRELQSLFDYEAQKKILSRPNNSIISVTSSHDSSKQ
ncbi:serine/threonine protein kinase [Naegleria gruberi]|uniref:non-specific serine/threonine protein kinase n=1 Tax=Naegleria gruberi TaxID=5762 RepID=D2V5Q4_NAEGR|nr:serine/threonine protein kinase [Naegleria gruberi]EFC47690.1 serine/threonine protein kinase [Naegleria gruberi]|eukprot:XP_002680434.1 serine/threonine protein kinase [Naegleria gruberi strain NEG-M]